MHTCVETKLRFPLFDEVMGYTGDPCIYIIHTGANHWIAVAIVFWYCMNSMFMQQFILYKNKFYVAAIDKSSSMQ